MKIRTKTSGEPMKWFGVSWGALVCEEATHVDIQSILGTPCAYCEEPIAEGDRGFVVPYYASNEGPAHLPHHLECFIRGIAGSVAHQMRQCSCYGHGQVGQVDCSEDGLSRRDAARLAFYHYTGSRRKTKPESIN
jgi:hypothetical protein